MGTQGGGVAMALLQVGAEIRLLRNVPGTLTREHLVLRCGGHGDSKIKWIPVAEDIHPPLRLDMQTFPPSHPESVPAQHPVHAPPSSAFALSCPSAHFSSVRMRDQ